MSPIYNLNNSNSNKLEYLTNNEIFQIQSYMGTKVQRLQIF